MTEEEKLDLILQEYKDRLSRHHPPGKLEEIAQNVCGAHFHSSAFQAYLNRIIEDGYIETDLSGDKVASHKGYVFSYVREAKNKRGERRWNRFTRVAAIIAFIISLISIGLTLRKEAKEELETNTTTSNMDSLQKHNIIPKPKTDTVHDTIYLSDSLLKTTKR